MDMYIHMSKSTTLSPELRALKTLINTEVVEDLMELQTSLRAEIAPLKAEIATLQANLNSAIRVIASLKCEIAAVRTTSADATSKIAAEAKAGQDRQLAIVQSNTSALMKTAATAIEKRVTTQILGQVRHEIDTKVMPQIENMVSYVNFNMADGAEIINDYRFAVDNDVNIKTITDGRRDNKIVNPHGVRTFYGYGDDDDD